MTICTNIQTLADEKKKDGLFILTGSQQFDLMETMTQSLTGRTGQILNLSSLGNDCGVNHNTVKSWVSVLEASFIIKLLRPYYKNFNKRLIKAPKLYFLDTGLASFLLGITRADQIFPIR